MTEDGAHKTTFAYDNDNRVTAMTYDGDERQVTYTYDSLGRIQHRKVMNGSEFVTEYGYVAGGYGEGSTTQMVASMTQGDLTLGYTYDSRGNIATMTFGGNTIAYTYDNLGQLVRVDDPIEGVIWTYAYDRGGNITSKSKYDRASGDLLHTVVYTYDSTWKDKLHAYNGVELGYDAIGNLTDDGTWHYTWTHGRQLQQMSKADATIQYQYGHNGLRVGKVVTANGVETATEYILNGKRLASMKKGADVLHFFYDAQGRPTMVDYNGDSYTYVHSYQGDIIGVLDNTGATVVTYHYDAWGKILATGGTKAATLGKLNPYRYRGYVYDEDTGLYYLRSRYYNPEWGRFVNADTYIGKTAILGQHNLFSYCANNPIGLQDENGTSIWDKVKGIGEQLAYNFLYSHQIRFWNTVCVGLNALGYKHSAALLNHSLQPNPANLSFSNDSAIAAQIKNDPEFKSALTTVISNQSFSEEHPMEFNADFDLFGSLHKVNFIVTPVTMHEKTVYQVTITDTYDFDFETDYSSQSTNLLKKALKAGVITGNNLAYLDMARGAINTYEITISFYVD